MAIDLDAVMAEVRARVQAKRASGVYGADVDAALHAPLPGGPAALIDELQDPLGSLAGALAQPVEYDPRSRKRYLGRGITLARRAVIGLIRWWIHAITERQERVNQLVAAALQEQSRRPSPEFEARLARLERQEEVGARLARLEREFRERKSAEVAANLHSLHFQSRFVGDEQVMRARSERFLDLFRGRQRVLDLGSGRGTFLDLAREHAIGAYGVDLDPRMVEEARGRGFDCVEADALAHLRSLEPGSIDGLYVRHVAEHILPGELVDLLREGRRVLAPGAPVVMVTPNVASLSVGAHTFWLDPSHRRPIPPELFRFYLEVEGFTDVALQTFEPSEIRLSEDLPAGAQLENARLLNETLFGDRDYAVIGRQPDR